MTRLLPGSLALAAFSAAMWFAWLGWDDEYHLVDGYPQGPYRAWQVIGCGVAVALATALAWWFVRTPVALFLLPCVAVLGFALPWAVDAAQTDDTGLWVVGLGMIVIGGTATLVVVLAVLSAFTPGRPRR